MTNNSISIFFFFQANISGYLPFLTFGLAALITSILILCLPETLQSGLPDTIDDTLTIGDKEKRNTTLKLST